MATQAVSRPGRRRFGSKAVRREALECYLFILPAVLGLVLFSLGPIVASGYLSLTDYSLLTPPNWVGLANYQAILSDPFFWQSLKVTATYVAVGLPLYTVASLLVALLMNQRVRGIGLFRTIFYLPSVISGVAVALLWRWLFNPDYGLLNIILSFFGFPAIDWLGTTATALPSLIGMGLWGIGADRIIYLFQWFVEPAVVTNGGPDNSTLSYVLYLYRNAFSYLQMGYGAALAWILFAIVLVLTLLTFRSSPAWVYYEASRTRR